MCEGASSSRAAVVAAPDVRDGGRRARAGVQGAARGERSEPWGIWKIAPVVSQGAVIGYGATCARHANAHDDVVCKRQLLLGKKNPISEGECRCRMKAWLLEGLTIGDGPSARDEHMSIMLRAIEPLHVEADLDAMAAEIAGAVVA